MTDDQPEGSAERSVLVQDAVSAILANTRDLTDVAERLLNTIGHGLGWEYAALWLIDRTAQRLYCVGIWHAPDIEIPAFAEVSQQSTFSLGVGLPGQVWAERQPIWLADLGAAPNFPRLPAAVAARLQSGLAFPILVGAEPVGVIECFSRNRRPDDARIMAAVATLGQQIGQFVGRTEAEQAAREREARASAIVTAALDAIVTIDDRGTVIEWNPAAERLFGISATTAIGQTMAELIVPPALREAHYAGMARYLRTGEAHVVGTRIETMAQDVEGREFPVELAIAHVPTPGPSLFTGYIRDLTERRRYEARQRFLSEASDILYRSLDPATTLNQLASLTAPFFADWCIIYLVADDGSIQRVAMVSSGTDADALIDRIQAQTSIDPDAADGAPAVIRSGQALLISDATTDLLVADVDDPERLRALIAPLGIRSWLCVPLTARGRTFGAISCISTSSQRRYGPDDLVFAGDLAYRAALAIDNARLFTRAEQAEVDARQHAERSQALADASRAFAQVTLDDQLVLDAIGSQVSGLVGGLCAIRLLSTDGMWLEPALVRQADPPAGDALPAHDLAAPQSSSKGLLGHVLQSGNPVLIPDLDDEAVAAEFTPEFQSFARASRIRGVIVVPLVGRAQVLGTLEIYRTGDEAPFTEADRDVLEDLAHRAALVIENARLYQQLRQALRQREEFLSIASHELKTPLTSMKAAGQLLARRVQPGQTVDAGLNRLVNQLVGETTRLETLVADLLDATRAQQGRLGLRREIMDLTALTRRVLERFEHAPERLEQHDLVLDAPGPIEGVWDPLRLDQVLTNLVSNALKYSPVGGEVRVTLSQDAREVTITVRDEGIGIDAQDQDQLFQPFARSRWHNRQFAGVGLGLYIAAQIVDQHGGTIAVTSTLGAGSAFQVTLPRQMD